jgi:uncharacterized membrane protein
MSPPAAKVFGELEEYGHAVLPDLVNADLLDTFERTFNPLLLHTWVAGEGSRIKYVLLIQVQDLATLADPDDSLDPITQRLKMAAARDARRAAAEKTTTSSDAF